MADEEVIVDQAGEPGVTVEVAPDPDNRGAKPTLTDEEVEKLTELPGDDEVAKYAKDAQKRIKGLHVASQEWRRRVIQSNKDVATATSLAEQLYRENQELKANAGRTEAALIEQAIQRAEAQLNQAKGRARVAYSTQNPDEIVAANEEVARFAAETDRLRLLKPVATAGPARPQGGAAAGSEPGGGPAPAPGTTVQMPPRVSAGTQAWLAKKENRWFNQPGEEEITGFAMGIHKNLENQGITEETNPQLYWATIDRRLREVYPQKFQPQQDKEKGGGGTPVETAQPAAGGRPVTVAGGTRTNGGANGGAAGVAPRHIVLSESQVRIAKALGLSPEQYATQLIKEEKGRVQ